MFNGLSEYALSAAILEIDLDGLGPPPYDCRPWRKAVRRPSEDWRAETSGLARGRPVRLFATGIRNAYRRRQPQTDFLRSTTAPTT